MRIGTGLTRHNLLKLILMLYLGNVFLPIVFNNLPFPFHSYNFYLVVTLGSFVVLYPYSFLRKELAWLYLYIALYFLMTYTVRIDRLTPEFSVLGVAKEHGGVLLAIVTFWHYIHSRDYTTLWFLCKYALILSFLSILSNFYIFQRFPEAFGLIVQGRASDTLVQQVERLGFIGYGFFNGISSFSPAIVYGFKNRFEKNRMRFLWIILFTVMFATLLYTETAAFVLFAMLFGGTALLMGQKYKKDLYRLLWILIIALFLPKTFIADAFRLSANVINIPGISDRFADAAITIEDPFIDYYGSTEHTGRRLGRIPLLFKSISRSPLIGSGFTTEHVAWLDWLSLYGIIGFFPWFMLIYNNTKRTLIIVPKSYVPFYLLGSIAFIAMGFLKSTGGYHVWLFWFLILPGTGFYHYSLRHVPISEDSRSLTMILRSQSKIDNS